MIEKKRADARAYYHRNKESCHARNYRSTINRRKRIREFLNEYLRNHPCIDCNESDIVVLDFDHRNRNEKEFCISTAIANNISILRLQKEIEKCDIRCANCHRRKTHNNNEYQSRRNTKHE